ncbi:conserved hypothetical protein [Tenacibaculum sediminilitoris]|uniref:hypothetical protein n=1 Tax=Tenacibaculum sediminilitoris TaxID=1820334 RepID=UPI0038955BD5
MIGPINIYENEKTINLPMGVYDVYLIGGWYVDLLSFNFLLSKVNGEEVIKPEEATLKSQSYYKRKRTKRIFSFSVNKGGNYKIEFKGQNSLILRKHSLMIGYLFGKKIETNSIEIFIERN